MLYILFVGLNEERSLQKKVDTRDELPARILHDPACIKESEDQLTRATRDLRTRDAKCTELCGCDFRTFIVDSNKSVISV